MAQMDYVTVRRALRACGVNIFLSVSLQKAFSFGSDYRRS